MQGLETEGMAYSTWGSAMQGASVKQGPQQSQPSRPSLFARMWPVGPESQQWAGVGAKAGRARVKFELHASLCPIPCVSYL